ncbi:MAG: hypothetical protein OXC55_03145 [Chloroflexi bacterium]|nr:hypothetical protein [Chloroflexota bacterium]
MLIVRSFYRPRIGSWTLEENSGSDKSDGGDNCGDSDGAQIPDGITADSFFALGFKSARG